MWWFVTEVSMIFMSQYGRTWRQNYSKYIYICLNTDAYVHTYERILAVREGIAVFIEGILIFNIFWQLSEEKDVKFCYSVDFDE